MAISPINDFAIKVMCEDPNYDIRPDGTIYTLITRTGKRSAKGEWRKLSNDSKNGEYIRVKYDYRDLYLHRVIAQKFIGDLNGLEVNHKDGNPANNAASNLELVTRAENQIHAFRKLNREPGRRKLDQNTADLIRVKIRHGFSLHALAKEFGVSLPTLRNIRSNKIWKSEVTNG